MSEWDQDVARTLEADPEVLPLLPALLEDPVQLGAVPADVTGALRTAGLAPGARVLDLGCGTGEVAVALARDLRARVEGVDALAPFVTAARARAREAGVADHCTFAEGDLRRQRPAAPLHDAALLLACGGVFGDPEQTVARLRTLVRSGGYMVVYDAVLADGAPAPEGYEGTVGRRETRARLTAYGDLVVQEVVDTSERSRTVSARNAAVVRVRAARLAAENPQHAAALERFVAGRERAARAVGHEVLDALWLLRKA